MFPVTVLRTANSGNISYVYFHFELKMRFSRNCPDLHCLGTQLVYTETCYIYM